MVIKVKLKYIDGARFSGINFSWIGGILWNDIGVVLFALRRKENGVFDVEVLATLKELQIYSIWFYLGWSWK